jgi:uncharacterized protein (DUF2141 family)
LVHDFTKLFSKVIFRKHTSGNWVRIPLTSLRSRRWGSCLEPQLSTGYLAGACPNYFLKNCNMNILHARMWIPPILLGMFISLISPPVSATQSRITVNLNGLRSQNGNVVVCLWRQQDKDFPLCSAKAAFQHQTAKPTPSGITVTFNEVPSGDYAVSAFLDENQNGTIDRGFMGRPKEPIALSNMTQMLQRRSRPSFEEAKFTVNGPKTISLSLRYPGSQLP